MKLIASPTSPYSRKVRIVLAEKKIEFDLVIDLPAKPDSIVSRYNPLGKVPTLLLDDESVLYDSRVIAEYLDNVTPNNRLIPASGRERINELCRPRSSRRQHPDNRRAIHRRDPRPRAEQRFGHSGIVKGPEPRSGGRSERRCSDQLLADLAK